MQSRLLWSFIRRLAFALLAAWIVFILGISLIYVYNLTHPACIRLAEPFAGYQDLVITTQEGVRLSAWWLPPQHGTAVILLGGHGASRDSMRSEAGLLARHGFGVLLLDTRSCAGEPATLGVREVDDLRAAVSYTRQQPGIECVAVLGFSAGAVTAIRGTVLMPEIERVIVEGNYYNLWGEIANSGAPPFSLEWQIERVAGAALCVMIGEPPCAVSPIADLEKIQPRPVLLIHGELEAVRNHAQAQYNAAVEPKELWIVPGADHGGYWQADPEAFEMRIVNFLLD